MSLLLLLSVQAQWQNTLVATARRLVSEGHYEVAIVTAIMACETAAERAFSYWFQKNGMARFEKVTYDLFPSFSLANDKICAYYVDISGDKIQTAEFWSEYKASAKLRGKVVHGQTRATKQQAENAVAASAAFTAHIAQAAK